MEASPEDALPVSHATAEVIALLRDLPRDTVIAWSDDTVGHDPVLTGGLDIWAPRSARPLHMN